MGRRGPSPLIPALMIGVLSMVVFWPYILIFISYVIMPSFQGGEEEVGVGSSFVMLLLPVSLLLLARAGFSRNRNWQSPSSPGSDGEGFGLGTLILLVLYFVLYNYM